MANVKTYKVEFILKDNELSANSNNDGFTAIELLGLLDYKKADIIAQIQGPDNFTRKYVNKEGQLLNITKEEDVE